MPEHASSVARPGGPGCSIPGRCVYGIPNFTASHAGLVSVKTGELGALRGEPNTNWYGLV